MLEVPEPTLEELKLEETLQNIVNGLVHASQIHKTFNPAPANMVVNAAYDPPNPGKLDGYIERNDLNKENYKSAQVRRRLRFNEIKHGVKQKDIELFEAANEWWRKSSLSSSSNRKSSHPVEVPAWFALAAYHKSQIEVEGMAEPMSVPDAMRQPEWEEHWKPAVEKEVIGLIAMDLWDEIPIADVPKDEEIFPGHFVFKIKTENGKFTKAKARYVFGGHKTKAGIDYFETAAFMAQMKSVRTIVSLAAGNQHRCKNFDIRQAFTFSKALKPIYMYLPDLEKMGIDNPACGHGKRSGFVARTKRMLYGMCDAGRAWMNLLDKFFVSIGALPTISDRMCYTWKGCRFAVHVDDILGTFPTRELEDEFETALRDYFGNGNVEVDDGS